MYYLRSLLLTIIIAINSFFGNVNGYTAPTDNNLVIGRFPTQVGNSWEYSRIFSVVVFDTVHNDTTEYLFTDSLHEEFQDIDTMANWECYRLHRVLFEQGSTFPETWWYAHPDTALLWIAYVYGSKLKISTEQKSNIKFRLGEILFDTPEALSQFFYYVKNAKTLLLKLDTIYWAPPKKLFVFPLEIGRSWVAMTDPWLEEREVVAEDSITTPAGIFFTLRTKIISEWMGASDIWYIYIAEDGVIKDTLHIRGIAIDTLGTEIGYFLADDVSELLDFQIGVKENNQYWSQTGSILRINPNPFTGYTEIRYTLLKKTRIKLAIYNTLGEVVAIPINSIQKPGWYSVRWNGKNSNGKKVPKGVYFYRFEAGEFTATKKMVKME